MLALMGSFPASYLLYTSRGYTAASPRAIPRLLSGGFDHGVPFGHDPCEALANGPTEKPVRSLVPNA